MINLKQLINAKAVIKQLNFRKAANAQNISQPALSRSIAGLEESLGVKLFDRNNAGVSMTVYGQTLDKYSEQILTSVNELEREIKIIKECGLGELSIALGPYPAEISGHRAIGKLVSASPNLRCKVVVSGWQQVENLVVNHQIDLGLAELSQVKNKYIETEPLAKHQAAVFCRSEHPLLKIKNISKTDLASYPLVMTEVPARVVTHLPGKIFYEPGSEKAFPSIEVEDLTLSRQIVRESDAISVAIPLQIEHELENQIFSIIPYELTHLYTNYGFMYLRDRTLSPAATRFMDFVRDLENDTDIRNRELLKHYLC